MMLFFSPGLSSFLSLYTDQCGQNLGGPLCTYLELTLTLFLSILPPNSIHLSSPKIKHVSIAQQEKQISYVWAFIIWVAKWTFPQVSELEYSELTAVCSPQLLLFSVGFSSTSTGDSMYMLLGVSSCLRHDCTSGPCFPFFSFHPLSFSPLPLPLPTLLSLLPSLSLSFSCCFSLPSPPFSSCPSSLPPPSFCPLLLSFLHRPHIDWEYFWFCLLYSTQCLTKCLALKTGSLCIY